MQRQSFVTAVEYKGVKIGDTLDCDILRSVVSPLIPVSSSGYVASDLHLNCRSVYPLILLGELCTVLCVQV